MKKLSCLILFILLTVSGCAGHRPIVDMQGVDANRYETDLAQCQQYAEQISPGKSAVIGAVAVAAGAAILGGVAAMVFDLDVGDVMGDAAILGGTVGAMEGAVASGKNQKELIENCMLGRGYKVL
jgi:outer membrane lipoprotein SlyB